jgi:hypothetical protein
MKAASVLGSPSSTASASPPLTSLRYQAQMMGEPVESVSGDLWPKTSVVMTDLRYGAPGQDLRPRSARYGDGRPPRLPGRSGGR